MLKLKKAKKNSMQKNLCIKSQQLVQLRIELICIWLKQTFQDFMLIYFGPYVFAP